MKHLSSIEVLGDSILKGIQVDRETKRYITKNEIDTELLSRRYGIVIHNRSHYGSTVEKGGKLLSRLLAQDLRCDAVVMDFGGNDCDFQWAEIAADPEGDHRPAVPLPEFITQYRVSIKKLKELGILPILTTLPPLEPQRFFDWWCRDLNRDNILHWLGSVNNIYCQQEKYSRTVEEIAKAEEVPLVDLRGAFLRAGHVDRLLCEDGTHPNSAGQELITRAFDEFAARRQAGLPEII